MKTKIRDIIFDKFHGRCAYCGCKLENRWHVDHIDPVVRDLKTGKYYHLERDNTNNLNPSCASCNIQKHSFTLEQFRSNIQNFINSLNNYSNQYKFAKKFGLITETNTQVVFYFENLIERKSNE